MPQELAIALEKHGSANPDAPTVIFVHGAMSRGRHFKATADGLTDLATVTYDRRGYGGSLAVGTGNDTYDDHASDLIAVIEATSSRGATVIGHSHGGGIALLAAVRHPGVVRSVGLWEPLLGWLPWWDPYPRQAAELVAAMSDAVEVAKDNVHHAGVGWDDIGPDAQARTIQQSAAYQADMRAALRAPFALSEVKVPVAIGIGSRGMPHACGPAPRLASELGAKLIEYDADHDVQRSAPPILAQFVGLAVALASGG